jgi:hypothetical protein
MPSMNISNALMRVEHCTKIQILRPFAEHPFKWLSTRSNSTAAAFFIEVQDVCGRDTISTYRPPDARCADHCCHPKERRFHVGADDV